MTNRAIRIVPATLAIGALIAAPLSAFAATQPSLAQAAVAQASVAQPTAVRGSLVSAVEVAKLTAADLDAAALDAGFVDAPKSRYDVTVHRLIYRTIDPNGRPTTASGIVVLPDGRRGALTVAEYLHGTTATKAYAASVDSDSTDRLITALFAGTGLAAVAPDYLGLGLGPGKHPYIDTDTETSASIDLLLAARTFTARHGVALKRDVLVTGFSQGGRATLGVGRALTRGEAGPFRLGEIRGVAGPYDLLDVELPAVFTGQVAPKVATMYLAYFTTAWDRTVGLYNHPREAFRAPYAKTVESLVDGTHTNEEIAQGLPNSPADLFTPTFYNKLEHPTGRFHQALHEADQICHNWTTRAPIHFYTGTKDTDVVPANATSCATSLRTRKATVTVHSMGDVNHFGTAMTAYPQIVRAWTP
ncbi:alpha/beta hydrolase family protein [Kribbella sp. NPDC056345]|uniref:alpha/beta hydrolase family protein n=1 Tax=Kribbella sp. NPDC056345 TaxID=3345789 RepID=UPI0035D86985